MAGEKHKVYLCGDRSCDTEAHTAKNIRIHQTKAGHSGEMRIATRKTPARVARRSPNAVNGQVTKSARQATGSSHPKPKAATKTKPPAKKKPAKKTTSRPRKQSGAKSTRATKTTARKSTSRARKTSTRASK